jgi:uncharacterized protein
VKQFKLSTMKKLVIAGGSGFLGEELIRRIGDQYDSIVVMTRSAGKINGKVIYRHWDAETAGDWCTDLEGASVVINLCGKSVDCRYTKKNKAEIFASRLNSTRIIGEAIAKANEPPELWINGASATIYQHSENTPMTEKDGEIGSGFSVEVCKAWEKTFNDFDLPKTRKVNLRISMVLGRTGGVLPVLTGLVKKGLGGTMGKGTQQVSWVHIHDFCQSVEWMIGNIDASGVYNIVVPEPVRNRQLMQLLRSLLNARIGLPATTWMLEGGAFLLGTETELVLKSRYSYPERLLDEGFKFKFSTIEAALQSLIKAE